MDDLKLDLEPRELADLVESPHELEVALSDLRPVEIAEAINALDEDEAIRVLSELPFDVAVQVLDEPELEYAPEWFHRIAPATAVRLIEAMSSDQQAHLFRNLEEPDRSKLLHALDPKSRAAISALLEHDPKTAGGLMTTEYLSVPADWTVRMALDHIHEVGRAKETVYAIYVLDPLEQRLVHVVSLRELMVADPAQLVLDVGEHRKIIRVSPGMPREEVARFISKYNLLAVPVVDGMDRVIGIVTVDDVIDALVAEQTEDVQKFGGMEALDEPYTEISFARMIRKRAGWLMALFVGEMLTATAMGYYEHELERAVVLALFIPLIISSGGNSGSQATSLIIRAMALREISLRDWWRVALRELPSGIALGSILGVMGFFRILLWQEFGWFDYGAHSTLIAFVVGLSLLGVVTFGSLCGSMLPFLLRKLGFDPASASAPFVATLVDVTGLVIYFSVAFWLLRGAIF